MKCSRLVALFAAVMFLAASPAFAQSFKVDSEKTKPAAVKIDLSPKAGGIYTLTDGGARKAPDTKIAFHPSQAQNKKPIMKRPLTWGIIAAVVILLILVAGDGYDSPGGY